MQHVEECCPNQSAHDHVISRKAYFKKCLMLLTYTTGLTIMSNDNLISKSSKSSEKIPFSKSASSSEAVVKNKKKRKKTRKNKSVSGKFLCCYIR